ICPKYKFKYRATAKRHVDAHYAVATHSIQCVACLARFSRPDSCKRHLSTARHVECHEPDAVGRYRIYDLAADATGKAFREFIYPITTFFYGGTPPSTPLPEGHKAQLAIVKERNRDADPAQEGKSQVKEETQD
ncbi:hypothetical protein DFQ27_009428, partial [Actinomortierella ambigua]